MNPDTAEVVVVEAAMETEVAAELLATEITERLLAAVSVVEDTAAAAMAVTAIVMAAGTAMVEDTDPVPAVVIAVVAITLLPRDTVEEAAVSLPAVGGSNFTILPTRVLRPEGLKKICIYLSPFGIACYFISFSFTMFFRYSRSPSICYLVCISKSVVVICQYLLFRLLFLFPFSIVCQRRVFYLQVQPQYCGGPMSTTSKFENRLDFCTAKFR